jgi:hypothetical protein
MRGKVTHPKCLQGITLIFVTGSFVFAGAQDHASVFSSHGRDGNALVRDVVRNEIESQLRDDSLWCYREQRQEDGKPSKTSEVCQTHEGDLERVVAIDGSELTPAQKQAENQRIQQVIKHPEQLRSKQRKDREDGEQQRNILRMLPDAFRVECESESGDLVTMRFRPNPGFHSSTRAAMVFRHLEGTLTVDARQKRLVEINGRLTSEVKFGGGLLGHLDKDGTFAVKQQDVGEGHWDLIFMNVHMSGKILFFKTINVLEKQILTDYRALPYDVSLQQAADFLKHDFGVHTASSADR